MKLEVVSTLQLTKRAKTVNKISLEKKRMIKYMILHTMYQFSLLDYMLEEVMYGLTVAECF
jgi:hypothetical protein